MLSLNKFLLVVFLVLSASVYGANQKGGSSGSSVAIAQSSSTVTNGEANVQTFTQTSGNAVATAIAQAIIKAGGCRINVEAESEAKSLYDYIKKNCPDGEATANALANAIAKGDVKTFANAFTFTQAKGCDVTGFATASGKCAGLRRLFF